VLNPESNEVFKTCILFGLPRNGNTHLNDALLREVAKLSLEGTAIKVPFPDFKLESCWTSFMILKKIYLRIPIGRRRKCVESTFDFLERIG
jgi:hypothetical protein